MKFSDLLPRPGQTLKAIKGDTQPGMQKQPWLQSVARNFGRGAFGNTIADAVDTKILGDVPVGMTTGGVQTPQNMSMQSQEMAGQQHAMTQPQAMQLLQAFLAQKGRMM